MTKQTKKKRLDASTDWMLDDVEVPTPDAAKMMNKGRKSKAVIRWVIYLSLPAFLALLLIDLNGALSDSAPPPAAPVSITDSPRKVVAINEVKTWLDTKPSPLPGATFVSWDSVKLLRDPSTNEEADGSQTEIPGSEVHSLTATDSAGSDYTITVQVNFSEISGAVVAGAPSVSLAPPAAAADFADVSDWGPDAPDIEPSDAVGKSVGAWADALFSGDPDALKLVVGDGDDARGYMPMPKATTTATVQAATLPAGAVEPEDPEAKPSTIIARVTLTPRWPGTKPDESNLGAYTYDVLVRSADTAAPRVTAWGPPGTGRSLTDYSNGLAGRPLTQDDAQTPKEAGK